MLEQAAIAVQDEQAYARLHERIDTVFALQGVDVFLNCASKNRLRIRDFAAVLKRGVIGKEAEGLYESLPLSDQGLTRERYLQLVEAVPQELRQRYFRVYANY